GHLKVDRDGAPTREALLLEHLQDPRRDQLQHRDRCAGHVPQLPALRALEPQRRARLLLTTRDAKCRVAELRSTGANPPALLPRLADEERVLGDRIALRGSVWSHSRAR